MHHLYPLAKGDPLCPLGFHPQVRWPTRCKRCFRDYKEHGGRKKEDDLTVSSPSLSTWNSSRSRDGSASPAKETTVRGWVSSQNLSQDSNKTEKTEPFSSGFGRPSATWTSTPDLGGLNDDARAVTISLTLPRRKPTPPDTGQAANVETSNTITIRRPSGTPPPPSSISSSTPAHLIITKNDSLAERVRKMQALKARSNSFDKESSFERDTNKKEKEIISKDNKSIEREKTNHITTDTTKTTKPSVKPSDNSKANDVNFLIKVKSVRNSTRPPLRGGPSKDNMVNGSLSRDHTDDSDSNLDDDSLSSTGTSTTESTLVNHNSFDNEQIESLKEEVESLRKRCEKVEKEKSEILLRRLASLDTGSSKTTSGRPSEMLKLQQKVNELTVQNEDLRDEKKSLQLKVREVEAEMECRPSQESATKTIEQLRSKLLAAETLCEELMDENEDMKRELRSMEEEIEEMQDNFREDQADEYSSIRKELEQTTKNCRVLSFKLKKTERKAEQLEQDKKDHEKKLLELAGGAAGLDKVTKIKQLEKDLALSNEVALRLQKELQDVNTKLSQMPPANQKKAPTLANIGKSHSADVKPSRASLTRGGSQEDPQQLLRDLQDSLEREADLREQLKNAEEEGTNLRKKASRLEDDNESLVLQLKKMATKARTRKLSPTPPSNRLNIENSVEKDEGISDEEDPAELRILLELNEQEASVLRRKVEEMEHESETMKTTIKDLNDKLSNSTSKTTTATTPPKKLLGSKTSSLSDEKVKVLESELADLRKKLIEKERDCERLHAELSLTQKKSKTSLVKSKSLDGANEQQNIDLKRQLQLIEQETSILNTKMQTLEAENDKLQAENKKLQLLRGAKILKSEKSLEQNTEKVAQLETELQQANAKIKDLEASKEASADKPEKKTVSFGLPVKKDAEALKAKQEELDKLKIGMKKIETEKSKLEETLKKLKEEAMKSFKPRTPKRPTDLTGKIQLKKMVEELEAEIGEMYIVMKNADLPSIEKKQKEMDSLENTIKELKQSMGNSSAEMSSEKTKLESEISKLKAMNVECKKEIKSLEDRCSSCDKEREQALNNYNKIQETNKTLDEKVTKLNNDLKSANSKQSEAGDYKKKIEDFKSELSEKNKQIDKMKKDIEAGSKVEEDKSKLLKEVGDKTKKITELEKKLKEAEDKCKRTDKMLNVRKERVAKLEKELSEEKEQNDNFTENQRRLSVDWLSERDVLKLRLTEAESKLENFDTPWKEKVAELEGKIVTIESQLAAKDAHIKQLEESMSSDMTESGSASQVELAQIKEQLELARREVTLKEQELTTLRQDLLGKHQEFTKMQDELVGSKQDVLKLQRENKDLDAKFKSQTKDSSHLQSKVSELEIDFQAERKRLERMKVIHEKDLKNKEIELGTLKGKLRTLEQTSGAGSKKIEDLKKEYEIKFKQMENDLASEKKQYDDLTSKYEMLEEEHVVTKAKLTIEKESAQGEHLQTQRELTNIHSELKSLQDVYNAKTDAWIKEKMDLQDKLSAVEERLCGGGWEVEKARLVARLEQKEREVDRISKERDVTNHLQEALKREVDELRQKLDDYDKVSKVQRNLTQDNTNMEREIKTLQNKIAQLEKSKKTDVAECKLRYEGQMQSIQDELQSVQTQVSRFKRERDMYKQMLDGAHKTMTDMRNNSGEGIIRNNRNSTSSIDELEESKSRIAGLHQQIACLEDGLCEAKMEASKARTELVSERSTSEIKLAEMQSKLNEFEEERLVASGRTKIPGLRTRLELAWQKEREEQQRLIQETSTLARDLRQTLFEVERERDKEKLDMKRRIDQLKKGSEEETEESKKKVTELQCDLLELRDAHAKLRTTNEKLRREKERHDREREQHKMSIAALKRSQQDEDRKITTLLELIDEIMKMTPDEIAKAAQEPITNNHNYLTPTPPRRHRSKSRSREATPEDSGNESSGGISALGKLRLVSQEVRAVIQSDRLRRQANMRRAQSTEPRDTIVTTVTPRSVNGRQSSLKKKSLSLEQTTNDKSKIWRTDDDSMSSLQSLDTVDILDTHYTMQRETSMDSRLSGGSTQSDVLPASEKKKKKGIFGKLKRLTKSRSIDDNVGPEIAEFTPISGSARGSDSDMSNAGSKRDLRGRLSDMFSKKGAAGGSSTSSISTKERKKELSTPVASRSDSQQRPLSRNGSSTQIATASPAPANEKVSQQRSASVTPGLQRKVK